MTESYIAVPQIELSEVAEPFTPHRLLAGGHRQTLAGTYLPVQWQMTGTRQHRVVLPDGDQLVLHDDCPVSWQEGRPAAMLVHGLCGCHQSRYLVRQAAKLCQRGVRAFRLDLRGCGAGQGLARSITHCGRYGDLEPPIELIAELAPTSPITVVGYSLGAALTLQLAVHGPRHPQWQSAVAVCPPIDLFAVERLLQRPLHRRYDRYLAGLLWKQLSTRTRAVAGAPPIDHLQRPRLLRQFDEQITAPLGGYRDADDYYRKTSVAPRLAEIDLPVLVFAAADDPIVPIEPIRQARLGPATRVVETTHGGHLGFVGRRNGDPDRYWLDWRVLEWVLESKSHNAADIATAARVGCE